MSRALKAVDGVIEARVFYDDKRARVAYDPEVVKPARLVEAVNDTGFGARLSDKGGREGTAPSPSDGSAGRERPR